MWEFRYRRGRSYTGNVHSERKAGGRYGRPYDERPPGLRTADCGLRRRQALLNMVDLVLLVMDQVDLSFVVELDR